MHVYVYICIYTILQLMVTGRTEVPETYFCSYRYRPDAVQTYFPVTVTDQTLFDLYR